MRIFPLLRIAVRMRCEKNTIFSYNLKNLLTITTYLRKCAVRIFNFSSSAHITVCACAVKKKARFSPIFIGNIVENTKWGIIGQWGEPFPRGARA